MITLKNKIAAAVTAMSFMAGGASAATIIDSNNANNPATWSALFQFDTGDEVGSVLATLDLIDPVVSTSTNTWKFKLTLDNNSTDAAIVTGWGFALSPSVTGFDLTGGTNYQNWDEVLGGISGNTNNGGTGVSADFCAASDNDTNPANGGNNCNSGFPGTGIAAGSSAMFEFTLNLASPATTISLSDAFVRLQAVNQNSNNNITSLKLSASVPFTPTQQSCPNGGTPPFCDNVNVIPLPAGLPLLLTALGGVGILSRRQRKAA